MYIRSCNSRIIHYELSIIKIISILQMIKLRHRRVKELCPGLYSYNVKAWDVLESQISDLIPTLGIKKYLIRGHLVWILKDVRKLGWRILGKGHSFFRHGLINRIARQLCPSWLMSFKAHTISDFIILEQHEAQRSSNELWRKPWVYYPHLTNL